MKKNIEDKVEKKTKKKEKKISKKKLETVKGLLELIKNNDTVMIASIKNLPSSQFQELRKKLRKQAEVIVVKKRIVIRAIEESGNKDLEGLNKHVQEDSAILFSKYGSFELAGILSESKNPIRAKPGQIAEKEIVVETGGTDLIPGPVISEFGALGIKIAVEDGKIAVKEKKVIVKEGGKISEAAASIMGKLEIKPFEIGIEPIAVYDKKVGKIYVDIKIDKKKTVEKLRQETGRALGLAQKIAFYCKETILFLLGKANAEEKKLKSLIKEEPKEEVVEEKKTEDIQENKSEEEK